MSEVARIQNHLLQWGAAGLDLNAFTGFIYAFNVREKIYDLCDYISGRAAFHPDWTRVGGSDAGPARRRNLLLHGQGPHPRRGAPGRDRS